MQVSRSKPSAQRVRKSSDQVRRTAIACQRCRARKTKCAGIPPHPCAACRDVGKPCVYSEPEKRTNVPESYVAKLQLQASASNRQTQDTPSSVGEISGDSDWGFTGTDNWVADREGQYRFLGNSSSVYFANSLNPTTETLSWHMYPHYKDTSWVRRSITHYEMPQLPPIEFARQLYQAQHSYIGTIFSGLLPDEFNERLTQLYSRHPDFQNKEECLEYCQVLLIFAFGLMYSVNQWTSNDGPPGFDFFKSAIKLLPDVHEDGSPLFVEALNHVAYYMQTINRRDAAYLYIGLAQRMAISLGLHQEISDQATSESEREHRRRVWWSTYSLERLLCVTSGHPISIQDEDIHIHLPTPTVDDGGALARAPMILRHFAELSQILGRIGSNIYRMKQKSSSNLWSSIRSIINELSEWFRGLPQEFRLDPSQLEQNLSREMVSIYLYYYHCVNITARPLLLYAVRRQMSIQSQRSPVPRWEDGLPPEAVNVIDTSIAAARSSTMILNAAAKFNIIATYGFIDGEQAFSAALLLVMVNIAFPFKEADSVAMGQALQVLQSMASKGNSYMRACHSLLSKIKVSIKQRSAPNNVQLHEIGSGQQEGNGVPEEDVPRPNVLLREQEEPLDQPISIGDVPFLFDMDEDPTLWNEVLDSIGIDMDRHWMENALLSGQGNEAFI